MATLGKKADDVGIAADELVASDDASGTKATAVARAVSQLLGEASKSGASTHVLQSAMNVADTAGKVIAAKRAKGDNVAALNESLKGDIRALHEALKEEPSKVPGPTPQKARKKDKPEEPKPATASDSTKKDKPVKKEKKDKAKKAKEQKRVEEVVVEEQVVKHEETRTLAGDGQQPSTEEEYYDDTAPVEYEPDIDAEFQPQEAVEASAVLPDQSIPLVQEQYEQFGQFPSVVTVGDYYDPNLPTEHITVSGSQTYMESAPLMQQSYVQQAPRLALPPPPQFRPPPPPPPPLLFPPGFFSVPLFAVPPWVPGPPPPFFDGREPSRSRRHGGDYFW